MTLRLRILLGYGYLVALLLLATGSAILGFFHLSSGVEVVLEENLTSVRAAMDMIESLERQDSATLAALIDEAAPMPIADLATQQQAFEEALQRAAAYLTEEGEGEIVAGIRLDFDLYRRARDGLVAERPAQPLVAYYARVAPPFAEVKGDVLRLLALNQQAMARTDRAMRELALRNGTWLGFVVALALVSFVFLSRAMQHSVLGRLQRLESGIQAIAAGQQQRLAIEGRDELALIARRVNELLDQYDRLERGSQGRLAQDRRLVLGLLRAHGDDVALFGLSGELLAGKITHRALAARLVEWIRHEGRELADRAATSASSIQAGTAHAEIALLLAPPSRPVGWLARVTLPKD